MNTSIPLGFHDVFFFMKSVLISNRSFRWPFVPIQATHVSQHRSRRRACSGDDLFNIMSLLLQPKRLFIVVISLIKSHASPPADKKAI